MKGLAQFIIVMIVLSMIFTCNDNIRSSRWFWMGKEKKVEKKVEKKREQTIFISAPIDQQKLMDVSKIIDEDHITYKEELKNSNDIKDEKIKKDYIAYWEAQTKPYKEWYPENYIINNWIGNIYSIDDDNVRIKSGHIIVKFRLKKGWFTKKNVENFMPSDKLYELKTGDRVYFSGAINKMELSRYGGDTDIDLSGVYLGYSPGDIIKSYAKPVENKEEPVEVKEETARVETKSIKLIEARMPEDQKKLMLYINHINQGIFAYMKKVKDYNSIKREYAWKEYALLKKIEDKEIEDLYHKGYKINKWYGEVTEISSWEIKVNLNASEYNIVKVEIGLEGSDGMRNGIKSEGVSNKEKLHELKIGDKILFSGIMYGLRLSNMRVGRQLDAFDVYGTEIEIVNESQHVSIKTDSLESIKEKSTDVKSEENEIKKINLMPKDQQILLSIIKKVREDGEKTRENGKNYNAMKREFEYKKFRNQVIEDNAQYPKGYKVNNWMGVISEIDRHKIHITVDKGVKVELDTARGSGLWVDGGTRRDFRQVIPIENLLELKEGDTVYFSGEISYEAFSEYNTNTIYIDGVDIGLTPATIVILPANMQKPIKPILVNPIVRKTPSKTFQSSMPIKSFSKNSK